MTSHGSTFDQHVTDVWLFIFYLSDGLVQVYEIELCHKGKTTENSDLVSVKNQSSKTDCIFGTAIRYKLKE